MRRSTRTAVFATAAVATSAAISRAEHASVTLSYAGAKSATSCPDEATFRGLVAARLGYDPFLGTGVRTLAVDFQRRHNEVIGRLDLSGDSDTRPIQRSLRASADDCFELATSMALVVAVAVDPNALHEGSPVQTPVLAPPGPSTSEAVARAPIAKSAEPARTLDRPARSAHSVRLQLGAVLALGIVPAPVAGARVGAGLDFGRWSVGAEGAFFSAGSRKNPAGQGDVSAFAFAGSFAPCVAPVEAGVWGFELCAVGSLGVLRSTAKHVARAVATNTLLATLAPRVATIVMLSRFIGVGASVEAPVALSRAHLHIEQGGGRTEVWAEPPVAFIGAVSLVASIQ